jgi:dTDP-4-dehydrorhamnose reductase
MRRLYVLGPHGMLGQMVRRYFSEREGWSVVALTERFDHENLVNHFRRYDAEPAAVFVNGIGAIPQKVASAPDLVLANVLLPLELARTLASHHHLVHPSTDCVFRGDLGQPYPSTAVPDATGAYAWSKLQAERILMARPNTLVLRNSIIGPNARAVSGLLQWFLSQPRGAALKGFTNQLWNGLTTLQWCVEVERLLTGPADARARLVQLGSREAYSKYEVLNLFKTAYRPDVTVEPVANPQSIDWRLQPDIEAPGLPEQLERLRPYLELA